MISIKILIANLKKRVEILLFGAGVNTRKHLNNLFKIRDEIFFKKKLPESENYPYLLVDPYEVFGEDHPYGDFNLVGEGWKDKSNSKPLAILWGFNNWKLGFVSAYLPEYRTAFAPRKIRGLLALIAIRRFPIKPSVFICWGYTESIFVRLYAKTKGINILRMEDGFLRSSAFGATHSTPYSLVLDSKGMHYNPDVPSDLEEMLNTHDFTEAELKEAGECLELFKRLRLSKYNPAIIGNDIAVGVKSRRKIAVLGQVDNDMAMRLGNTDGWKMIELIRLAKIENPDADIYYRPHPDIYHGYRRSRLIYRSVEKYCRIASPDIPLVDFIESVDHVYTITSLSGLEALIRGIKVTVVGAAFYAGWGVTDDRVSFPRRNRKVTLDELFAAVYIKYPRYLGNLQNSEIGFKATCYRILADQGVESFLSAKREIVSDNTAMQALLKDRFWPQLYFGQNNSGMPVDFGSLIRKINIAENLMGGVSRRFQRVLIFSVFGKLSNNKDIEYLITRVKGVLSISDINDLLLLLSEFKNGSYIHKQLAGILIDEKDFEPAISMLKRRIESIKIEKEGGFHNESVIEIGEESIQELVKDKLDEKSENRDILVGLLDAHFQRKDYQSALSVAENLLISGFASYNLLLKISKILELMFDYKAAAQIARFAQKIDLLGENKRGLAYELYNFPTSPTAEELDRLKYIISKDVKLSPERINLSISISKKYLEKEFQSIIEAMLFLDANLTVNKAMAYLEIGRSDLSMRVLENLFFLGETSDKAKVIYSRTLSDLGRYEDAISIMQHARKQGLSEMNVRETLRLLTIFGDYDEAAKILSQAELYNALSSEAPTMSVHLGKGRIEEAYRLYTQIPMRDDLILYFGKKYKKLNDLLVNNVLFIAAYGPGDEIRFSSIYKDMSDLFGVKNFKITCDYRLYKLLERSFPHVNFCPTRRVRNYGPDYPRSDYSLLPGSDLCTILDNNSISHIDSANEIALVTDYIWHFRKTYDNFPGHPVLVYDSLLKENYLSQLPVSKLLVGICWRSSLNTSSRNVNYLSIDELGCLFEIEGIQFVNFQYDDCVDELEWVEDKYPGKLLDIKSIDHYNDLDSVASLMACMDLIIAPATSVIELAGALGCNSWLISNHSDLNWRKRANDDSDIWFNTIRHIEGKKPGDKNSIIKKMRYELISLRDKKQ